MHPGIVGDERDRARTVQDLDSGLLRELRFGLDQSRAAAYRLDREAAPELELAADLERLPAPSGGEAHAALSHPLRGGQALLDQDLGQVRIAAELGHPRHVVEKLLLGVGAEVGIGDLGVGEVGDQCLQVLGSAVDEAEKSRGKARIAAGFLLRGSFQHENLPYGFGCGQRRAQSGVTAANHDDVVRHQSAFTPAFWITSFQRACSFPMKSAYSCGVEPTASASSALKRSATDGLLAAFAASSARRLMIAGGVFAGAFRPYHWLASKPG